MPSKILTAKATIKPDIDAELAKHAVTGMGIKLGTEAYRTLLEAGVITFEKYTLVGLPGGVEIFPTYDKKCFAWHDPDLSLQDWEVEVGNSA